MAGMYIYIGAEGLDYGFEGEWFDAPFKAQFMIYNQSLFKWDKDAEDGRDYTNFRFIGNAFLDYKLTEKGTMLTYTLKKSVLGEGSALHMRFYFALEQTGEDLVALIPAEGIDTTEDPVIFPKCVRYTQKKYGLYTPHGYYLSEEIPFKTPVKGAAAQCLASAGKSTDVKFFVRVKEAGRESFNDYERPGGLWYFTDRDVTHIQYAVALNTTDGKKTPSFTDVRITPGDLLPPQEYTDRTAEAFLVTAVTQKIRYEHGEK